MNEPHTLASAPSTAPLSLDPSVADALSALRPLETPPPIPWWPPAPGWFVLAGILCLLLIGAGIFWWRRRRFLRDTRYRREAIALLNSLPMQVSPATQLMHIAQVLRRAAVSAWGRDAVAQDDWRLLLARAGTESTLDERSVALLQHALYRREAPAADDVARLQTQASAWLQHLPPVRGGITR